MQTSSTVEMVTISRAEYERLQQENAQMEATRVRLEAERIKLEAEHARLEAKFAAREQEQAQVITSLCAAMFMPPMIFSWEMTVPCSSVGTVNIRCSRPSTRIRTTISVSCGSKWMSLARS